MLVLFIINSVNLICIVIISNVGINERKEKQKEELRRMILDASMKLFTEEGFERVSIRRIADIIEYSPTTIYLYFKDKNDILFELCEQGFQKMEAMNADLASVKDPLERLHQMGKNYIRFGLSYPEYYDLMFNQSAPMERLQAMNGMEWQSGDRALQLLKSMIGECMHTHQIPKGDVESVAMAFWGMVHGLVALTVCRRFEKLVNKDEVVSTMYKALEWMIDSVSAKKPSNAS